MNYRKAQKLKVGDLVLAPKIGLHRPIPIEAIAYDDDKRVRLLFTLQGEKHPINYGLIEVREPK